MVLGPVEIAWWQIILLAFFVLLPTVLMFDFWGDERLTSRGRPVPRSWPRAPERGAIDDHAEHGDLDEAQPTEAH